MSAANDSVDPVNAHAKKRLEDLAVPEQAAEDVVGGSTTLSAGTEFEAAEVQTENRTETAISNIMQAKQDAIRNAINNVR